ncbi:xanthine phosphoribosyltransferase [Candidatus Bipolaricaulota bacterium]|nr:xanthine phosphoribosyltransferase [Candidatus Bipolaricaulota bacterium]
MSTDLLKSWIKREGKVVDAKFLRVDGFLNHRIAPEFVAAAGRLIADAFLSAGIDINCVLTAEAAGNVIAYEVARQLGAGVRALYAKKGAATTMAHPITREVVSPTKKKRTTLAVSADYLNRSDRVLIVDDFLFEGITSCALAEIVAEAEATLVGLAFVIEKGFAPGRSAVEQLNVPVLSLVTIESMDAVRSLIRFAEVEPEGIAS